MSLELLLFDMDGTLVQYPEGSFQSSWDALGFAAGKKEEWLEVQNKYLSCPELYEQWIQENCKLLKGISVGGTLGKILPPPELPGTKDFFSYINQLSPKPITGLVTGGVDLVANYLQRELGLDFGLANEVHTQEGCFTGTGKMNVPLWRKGELVKEIQEKYKVPKQKTAFFGDNENDIPAWQAVSWPIAVNLKKNKEEATSKCLAYVKYSFEDFYEALEVFKSL